jgi:hypothetical protein
MGVILHARGGQGLALDDSTRTVLPMINSTEAILLSDEKFLFGTGYVDRVSGVKFIGYHPRTHPDEWRIYLDGAKESYQKYEIGGIEWQRYVDGDGVLLFFIGYSPQGEAVAGIRFHGPIDVADASIMVEMAASEDIDLIRDVVSRACEEGAVEVKGMWSVGAKALGISMLATMVRSILVALEWLDIENAFATTADRALVVKESSGAELIGEHPVAWPDERYRTVLVQYSRSRSPFVCSREHAEELANDIAQLASRTVTR